MKVSQKDLELLSNIIQEELKKEFEVKHLSKNLINTIFIEKDKDEIKIHIPAKTYNMLLFMQKGVVVHTSHGSYAEKLNKEGSKFNIYPNKTRKGYKRIEPGNHKGFVERVINTSLRRWTAEKRNKYEVVGGLPHA